MTRWLSGPLIWFRTRVDSFRRSRAVRQLRSLVNPLRCVSLGFGVVDWRSCLDTSPDGSLVRVEPSQGTYKQFYMPTDTPSKVFQSRSFIEESGILWIWLSQPSIGVTGSWNSFYSRFLQSSRLFGALSNAWEGSGSAFIVWPLSEFWIWSRFLISWLFSSS